VLLIDLSELPMTSFVVWYIRRSCVYINYPFSEWIPK